MGYRVTKKFRSKYETYKPKEVSRTFNSREEAVREARNLDRSERDHPSYKHVKFWKATVTKTKDDGGFRFF